MHSCLLDVPHDGGDVHLFAVAKRVHVELDRVLDEPIHENLARHGRHRRLELIGVVTDAHRPAPEHVRGPDEHGVADLLDREERPGEIGDDRPRWAADAELLGEKSEALAVLGEVDGLVRRAEDAVATLLDRAGEAERRLSAELRDHADRLLTIADGEHFLG